MRNFNIFDRTLKIIARNYASTFLEMAFPELSLRLVGTLENVEISLPVRPVDFVHRLEYEGQEYLLHLEFQLEHEADFPRRMCRYYGLLTTQFELPVISLVLYLRPRQSELPSAYQVMLGERVVNRFSYASLKLWDYTDAIRAGQYPGLAPLLTMLISDPDEQLLAEERELIRQEPEVQKRAEQLMLAITVANRYFEKEFLWRFFREEVEQMRESTIVEDWVQEGIEKGLQQGIEQGLEQGLERGLERGIAQGKRRTTLENILHLLEVRFQLSEIEKSLIASQLRRIADLDALREFFGYAITDDDLNVFINRFD
ncbi:MAG: hypothetical protein U9Q70_06130 [Chloroflexota bacterium]|nr:hypothetical protein [Chloroflexota bacterium]